MENHVTIAVDPGASGIKVVCSVNGDDPHAFLIPPYVIQIDEPKKLVKDTDFDKNNLWVRMGKDYYAVGSLAERCGASQLIKPQKFISAPSKICAAIGLAMQTLEISSEFALSLSCVLPPTELGDAEITVKNVRSAINSLEYPSGKVKIQLKSFNIYPEGYGILNAQNLDLKQYDSIVTIMMGHRNISMFETKRGYAERPYTDLIGFYDYLLDIASETGLNVQDLIEPVCARLHCISDNDLNYYKRNLEIKSYVLNKYQVESSEQEEIINKLESTKENQIEEDEWELERYIQQQKKTTLNLDYAKQRFCEVEQELKLATQGQKDEKRFHHLIRCEGKDRDYTAAKIQKTETEKYKKYIKKMQDWVSERLPARPKIICVAGGTAKYLDDDIYSFLAQKGEVRKGIAIPFKFHADSEIETLNNIKITDDPSMANWMEPYRNKYDCPLDEYDKEIVTQLGRFEDIYGLFRHLQALDLLRESKIAHILTS